MLHLSKYLALLLSWMMTYLSFPPLDTQTASSTIIRHLPLEQILQIVLSFTLFSGFMDAAAVGAASCQSLIVISGHTVIFHVRTNYLILRKTG